MGQALYPERSAPAPPRKKLILSLSESENEVLEHDSESSEAESTDDTLPSTAQAQLLWKPEVLSRFGLTCASVSEDTEFNKMNNKLLNALKEFSSKENIYCTKCKTMTSMTKKGKVNSTYQFACGTHTISATQILRSLPDAFILKHIPKEPRHIHNQTLSWIGKEQLSPELLENMSSKNAVKRYRTHRSPIKPVTSSLLTSRNQVNEVFSEMKHMKHRLCEMEKELIESTANSKLLEEMIVTLKEQLKAIKEENALLKKFLNSPKVPQPPALQHQQKNSTADLSSSSYACVTDYIKPMNKIMRFYTKAESTPRSPTEVVSARAPQEKQQHTRSSAEFSPYKLVFFRGCHRKPIGEYKKMLPSIGFEAHWARHICFLAEDIVQITTFESKVDTLIKAITSISNDVKHLKDFNPLVGASYVNYGTFSDDSASKCYFTLMKQAAKNISADAQRIPSLRRLSAFFSKIVESQDVSIKASPRPTRIFCLGNFIIKKEPVAMEVDIPKTIESYSNEALIIAEKVHQINAADLVHPLKSPALSVNAQ